MALDEASGSRLTRSTAEGAALLRAAGHLARPAELSGPDDLAARFIAPGLSAAALVKVPGLRRLMPRVVERLLPGGLWFEVARTRGMDDLLLEEVAAGAQQVVVLGAGLDSRPYRLRDRLADAVVFEVDHPVTAAYKRERVDAVVADPPVNVRYAEIDFEREDLGTVLEAAGHDPAQRSVVLWSGVTPYLEGAAVEATLAWVARQAPGTTVGFDYCWAEAVEGELDHLPGAANLRRRVAAQGEPLRWGIPRGHTEPFLARHGLECVEDLDGEEAERRYCTDGKGNRVGWMWSFGGFARARVPQW